MWAAAQLAVRAARHADPAAGACRLRTFRCLTSVGGIHPHIRGASRPPVHSAPLEGMGRRRFPMSSILALCTPARGSPSTLASAAARSARPCLPPILAGRPRPRSGGAPPAARGGTDGSTSPSTSSPPTSSSEVEEVPADEAREVAAMEAAMDGRPPPRPTSAVVRELPPSDLAALLADETACRDAQFLDVREVRGRAGPFTV